MAQVNGHPSNIASSRADQPWLLPSNRKLRNIIAVSIRNLFLVASPLARNRGKTIDDDALPQTLTSPAKLVALREQKTLGLSRSSTDLRAVAEDALNAAREQEKGHGANGSPTPPKQKQRPQSTSPTTARRPNFTRRRRRSTIEWANATPQRRQEQLEHVTKERMTDVFYTLHVPGIEEPVYISEIVEKTMNPTFRHVDWSTCGPGVTRLQYLTIRIWANGGRFDDWKQLLELRLDLTNLTFLGKNLDHLTRPLPQNAILLQLSDGVYTSFPDDFSRHSFHPEALQRPDTSSSTRPLPTSSFDALLRLSKLDDSIQDALAIRDQIANDLEALLQSNREALNERDEVAEAEDRLKTIEFAKKTVQKQLEKAHKQQDEKRDSISSRRRLMTSDGALQERQYADMQKGRPNIPNMREEDQVKTKAIQNQRRRICEELQHCYPIEPVTGKTLAFSIRGLHLPNSESLDTEPPEVVSAAFGYVAQVLQLLAFYLKQALPYPVTPRGNTTSIYDPISILKTNNTLSSEKAEISLRTYPLFSKGVPRFRFEYAVFLLNQDIRILLENAFNLRVLDIRQTLPNLKYLLYVATAGEGELPARKAGGIRGLVRGPVTLERVGSTGSASSGMSGLTLWENGRPRSAADRLREISGGKGKEGVRG